MMRQLIRCLPLLFFATAPALSQSLNDHTELLGRFQRAQSTQYSDIWGYAADGREYALIGTYEGLSIVDVTDPTNTTEVAFIPGPKSIWRDIKTYSHYAYVVHDANDDNHPEPGVQIIDLSALPDSARLVATYRTNMGDGTAHNLYIDGRFAYIAGNHDIPGAIILDLTDPENPNQVGAWTDTYWHDVVALRDTLYGSVIFDGAIEIVDATDKSQLKLIARKTYPNAFTHNAWMTDDNRYLSQTDEVSGLPVNFWDLSDPTDPRLVARYAMPAPAIAHNTHIRGDYVFLSYYCDGLRILDISQRRAPVEVGYYDSYPDDQFRRDCGFDGAWGVYPFLPSGRILISDITYGLFVVRFDSLRAGHIRGTIRDRDTGTPLAGVHIELLNPEPNEGRTDVVVPEDGSYVIGAKPGLRRFRFSKFGYHDRVVEVNLESGTVLPRDVELEPLPRVALTVQVVDGSGAGIPEARVVIRSGEFRASGSTDAAGRLEVNLPETTYVVSLIQWGWLRVERQASLSAPEAQLTLETQPGYVETFTEAEPWSLSAPGDDSRFSWFIANPADRPFGPRLPGQDHTGDADGLAVLSRAHFGRATLTSPPFDATRLEKPVLQFARFYNPYRWARLQANDTLKVLLSNDDGQSWVEVAAYTRIDHDWQVLRYAISDYLMPTTTMRVRFVNIEGPDAGSFRGSSFCMLDDIQIVPEAVLTSVAASRARPDRLELLPNYPNPFNPVTTVAWNQPQTGEVELIVYNLLGQRVLHLDLGRQQAGRHRFTLDFGDRPSGVYFYSLRINGVESRKRKMLLLR